MSTTAFYGSSYACAAPLVAALKVNYLALPIGSKVHIEGDRELTAVVIQVTFDSGSRPAYKCSWLHNGRLEEAWVDEFRIMPAED